jgi:hypothetical protein
MVGTGPRWDGGWVPASSYGIYVWDLVRGESLGQFQTTGPVAAMAVSADGTRLASAEEDKIVYLRDLPGRAASESPDPATSLTSRSQKKKPAQPPAPRDGVASPKRIGTEEPSGIQGQGYRPVFSAP